MKPTNTAGILASIAAVGAMLVTAPADAQQYYDNYSGAIRGTSCDRGFFNNQNIGLALGAALGGLLGSQFGGGSGKTAMTIAGVIGGGFLGNQVGAGMDQADQGCVAQTLDYAPSGRPVAWENPDNHRRYRVTPHKVFYRQERPCREVTTEAWIGGRRQNVNGVACRRPDGSWEFQNPSPPPRRR